MNCLEARIAKDGIVKEGNVLKVDSFLNHQMDIALMEEIGREFKRRFGHKQVDKVLTIEASGIGIAAFVAKEFGVPMVFAKKSKSINIDGDMFVAEVESFTHKNKNQVIVSKKFLHAGEHVLIIDDFLANGCALQGLINIVESASAIVEGCGIVIEKSALNFSVICSSLTLTSAKSLYVSSVASGLSALTDSSSLSAIKGRSAASVSFFSLMHGEARARLAAASSSKSMALSGKKRSVI